MAGISPYGSMLAAAGGGPPAGPPPGIHPPMGGPPPMGPNPAAGPGPMPPMPSMPGLPPAPTGVGKMNTGAKSPKDAASDAILSLRDLKSHFPAMAMDLDGTIEKIKAATNPGGAAGAKGANDGVKPPGAGGLAEILASAKPPSAPLPAVDSDLED